MSISRNAHEATRFVAVANLQTSNGPSRETIVLDPSATIKDVFETICNPPGFRRLGAVVLSIELLPDATTVPERDGLFGRETSPEPGLDWADSSEDREA